MPRASHGTAASRDGDGDRQQTEQEEGTRMPGMTDRDHFAAAALTGLLSQCAAEDREAAETAAAAMRYADAMLRERAKTNHDAAPAAIVPEPEPSAARRRPAGGTGDTRESLSGSLPADLGDGVSPSENDKNLHHTQEIAAYARFAGSVMKWIDAATDDFFKEDKDGSAIVGAWWRCRDAYDRIVFPTIHGAAPAVTASVESVAPQPTTHGDSDRTDNAAPRPSDGTGDTQEPVAWGVANGSRVLATSISRMDAVDMQSDYACDTEIVPLYRSPPVTKPMPKEKRAEVSAGPLAWAAIRENGQPLWLSYDRSGAEGMVNGMAEVVPLYRSPTLTDAEREAIAGAIESEHGRGAWQWADALHGLLERLK